MQDDSDRPYIDFNQVARLNRGLFGGTTSSVDRSIASRLVHLKIPKPGLTDSLSWFEDDVTAVEHQQANDDEYNDPQSETGLKGQRQHWLFSFQFHPVSNNSRERMFKLQRLQKKKPSNFRHSGLRSKQKQNLACWKNWAQHLFDSPRYAEDGRAHHRVPYGEATTGERAEKPSEQAGGSKTEGGHDQEGAAQHSHGDDAGVFGGVVAAGDFKSRSKRTVNVDFLWRGDDVVGRALKRQMVTSITDGMNTFRPLGLFICELL